MNFRFFFWELRHLRSEPTFAVVLLLLLVLSGLAISNGSSRLRDQQAKQAAALSAVETSAAATAELARKLDSGEATTPSFSDPRTPSGFALRHMVANAVKPSRALAALSVGQSDLYPSVHKLALNSRDSALTAAEYENPQRLLIGSFDVAFVVIYIVPLLLLGLTYNLVSAERERGTLPLILLQQGSVKRLALGRSLFLGVCVLLALVAILLGGLSVTGLLGQVSGGALFGWLAVAFFYGLFWVGLAVFVSSRGGASATNAVVLAGAWLVFTIIVPSTVSVAAKAIYPVPSRMAYIDAQRVVTEEARNRQSQLLAEYFEDHPELASAEAQAAVAAGTQVNPRLIAHLGYQEQERLLAPVRARYTEQLERQQGLVDALKYLSPALLAQAAFNDLSGTGMERHREFQRQAGDFHDALRDFFQPKIIAGETFTEFDQVPRFVFEEAAATSANATAQWLVLALGAALLLAASLPGLGRYSPNGVNGGA